MLKVFAKSRDRWDGEDNECVPSVGSALRTSPINEQQAVPQESALRSAKACSDKCDECRRRPLTQLGADLWRPDHGVEHDVADPMRTFVDDFDSIIHELVLPMSQQDTLQLRNISSVSPVDCIQQSSSNSPHEHRIQHLSHSRDPFRSVLRRDRQSHPT